MSQDKRALIAAHLQPGSLCASGERCYAGWGRGNTEEMRRNEKDAAEKDNYTLKERKLTKVTKEFIWVTVKWHRSDAKSRC